MSSTAVSDSTQANFNPSWMKPCPTVTAVVTKRSNSENVSTDGDTVNYDHIIADPIFVTNRYGREDLLALLRKEAKPPEGLDKCLFFIDLPQQPICLIPFSEIETKLQHNINSSKAMNCLSHADRSTIMAGGMLGQSLSATATTSAGIHGGGGQPFTPAWMTTGGRGASQSMRGGTFGCTFRGGRGGVHGTVAAANPSTGNDSQKYIAPRGGRRGGLVSSRGAGGIVQQPFNSRAQGLYDRRDPRDRPRQRLRSTSDEVSHTQVGSSGLHNAPTSSCGKMPSSSGDNEWHQVGKPREAWVISQDSNFNQQHKIQESPEIGNEPLPEWMNDDHDRDRASTVMPAGSFDEKGQFQEMNQVRPTAPTNTPHLQLLHNSGAVVAEGQILSNCSNSILSGFSQVSNNYSGARHDAVGQMAKVVSDIPSVNLSSSNATSVVVSSESKKEWYYLDPKNELQGPFPTSQMQAWFKSGYFSPSLKVRRSSCQNFVTLGELLRENASSPFLSKPLIVESTNICMALPAQSQQKHSRNIWEEEYNSSMLEVARVQQERQKLEEEQMHILEQQRRLNEMQETLLREQQERVEKERLIKEKEVELRRQEEELARQATIEKERAAARERELELERKRMTEEMEKAKRAELERLQAEEIKRQADIRNAEIKRLTNEENERAKRLIEEKEKEEEKRHKLAEQKERQKQEAIKKRMLEEEETRKSKEIAEKEVLRQKQLTEGKKQKEKIVVREVYSAVSKTKISPLASAGPTWQTTYHVVDGKPVSPKVAPWITVTERENLVVKGEKSLVEIQQEEERISAIEKKKHDVEVNAVTAGAWSSNSLSKTARNKSVQSMPKEPSRAPAWGGATLDTDNKVHSNPSWDSPPLDTVNKESKKISSSSKPQSQSRPSSWSSATKKTDSSTDQEALAKLFRHTSNGDSAFISWIVERVKQLNPEVDADIFALFIKEVDNPEEVEDYALGYLGESNKVKDFVREFTERKREDRLKKLEKDDLSRPAVAADAVTSKSGTNSEGVNSNSFATGKKKKKSGKGGKLLVDGACLGFKGTADSNRVNVGEIETLMSAPASSRR